MKYYLIQTTTKDKYEMAKGIYIVSAETRTQAEEIFLNSKLTDGIVTSITLLKSAKQKLLFSQSPVIY